MDNLIKEDIPRAKMFHGTFRFVDNLCALTDGENFQTSYKEIYPKGLVLKLEHSGYHAAFLDLNIAISNGKISTTLYDKHEDFFLFACQTFIATSHHLFFMELWSVMLEIFRIARSYCSVLCFYGKTNALITRTEKKDGNKETYKKIMETYENHQLVLQKYNISNKDILKTFQWHYFIRI